MGTLMLSNRKVHFTSRSLSLVGGEGGREGGRERRGGGGAIQLARSIKTASGLGSDCLGVP